MTSRKKTTTKRTRKPTKAELKRAGIKQKLPGVDASTESALSAVRNISMIETRIKSTSDFGYEYHRVSEANQRVAGYAKSWLPGVETDSISEETWAQFESGVIRAVNEFLRDDGHLVCWLRQVGDDGDTYEILPMGGKGPVQDDGPTWEVMDVPRALGYVQQDVGSWNAKGGKQPNLYAIVMPIRTYALDKISKAKRKVVSDYKKFVAEQERMKSGQAARIQANPFKEKIFNFLEALPKSNTAAHKRGDDTALDPAKLRDWIAESRVTLYPPKAKKAKA